MSKVKELKKKERILIIGIIMIVLVLIGSAYAFFMYSKTSGAYVLTSGKITAKFIEGTNEINFNEAFPLSDAFALNNIEKLDYIDFTVTADSSNSEKITYEIYLTEDQNNTLDINFIKFYLVDDNGVQVAGPINFGTMKFTSYPEHPNGRIVFKETISGEFNKNYRLYMWLDGKYEQNILNQNFGCKVNLYAYNS